jgi:hypothetical protein
MPNESHAQLAKYVTPSASTVCCVGTPENGGAMRIDTPSGSSTSTRWARRRANEATTSSSEALTFAARSHGDGLAPVAANQR